MTGENPVLGLDCSILSDNHSHTGLSGLNPSKDGQPVWKKPPVNPMLLQFGFIMMSLLTSRPSWDPSLISSAILISGNLTVSKSQGETFTIILIGPLLTPQLHPSQQKEEGILFHTYPPLSAGAAWSCEQSMASRSKNPSQHLNPCAFDN